MLQFLALHPAVSQMKWLFCPLNLNGNFPGKISTQERSLRFVTLIITWFDIVYQITIQVVKSCLIKVLMCYIKNPAKAVTQNITSPALMCLPSRSSSVKVVLTELGNEKIKLRTSLKMKYNIITTPKCIYMHVINRN